VEDGTLSALASLKPAIMARRFTSRWATKGIIKSIVKA
jgi:hypothetical protein